MSYKRDSNIFVGCMLGTLRGIQFYKAENEWKVCAKNLQNVAALGKDSGIVAMNWGDEDEMDILIGMKNQHVKTYDTDYKAFTSSVDVKYGKGQICGISKYDECLLTAVESGHIRVWRFREKAGDIIDTGFLIQKMRNSKVNSNIVAIGCKQSADLRLFDLNSKQFTFISKNVKPNELQLQVPIWPSDIAYLPSNDGCVAVCTKYGQVRLYDTKGSQRRPVINFQIPDQSLTCMSATPKDRCVVVGSGRGMMKLIDFRGKGLIAKSYKGPVGGLRSIGCSATEPYIVSACLDRYLYIHHMDTAELLYKGYHRMRHNSVLVRSRMILPDVKEEDKQSDKANDSDDDIEIVAEYDNLFDNMMVLEES